MTLTATKNRPGFFKTFIKTILWLFLALILLVIVVPYITNIPPKDFTITLLTTYFAITVTFISFWHLFTKNKEFGPTNKVAITNFLIFVGIGYWYPLLDPGAKFLGYAFLKVLSFFAILFALYFIITIFGNKKQ